jgi:nicotinic acid mononucleotide adenylyltransferase
MYFFNSLKKIFSKNDDNFDYTKINNLLKTQNNDKENIVLLTTGSFNPIHRMHLEIVNIAYNHLMSLNKYNVLCALISPSADCYVKYKSPLLIPFESRCDMIKSAIEEYKNKNLPIFLHKWEGSQNKFIDFPEVISEIQSQLDKKCNKIKKVIYVCGMDHFCKCRYLFNENVIAIDRKPFINHEYEDIPENLIYLVKDEKNEKSEIYSSTAIREIFNNDQIDDNTKLIQIKEITFDSVAEKVLKFYKNHFKNGKKIK